MRKYSKTVGALAAASALAAGFASAQDIEGQIHVGYTNAYLFRGLNLGQDLVEAGVDLSYQVADGLTISGGAWYASVHNGAGNIGKPNESFDELDLYAEVSKEFDFATFAVGYIYYHLQENFYAIGGNDPQEVYFSVSRDFGFAEASLTYFWDIDVDNDGYLEAGLSKGIELNECLTLNVNGALGYYVEHGKLAHFTTTVSLDWAYSDTVTLSPFVSGSLSLSDKTAGGRALTLNGKADAKDQFVGGVKFAVGF